VAIRFIHGQATAQIAQALFDAFNAHDLDRLEALTSEGFLGIGPDSPDLRMGRRGGRAWAAAYFAGFPDSKWTKERIFTQDNAFVLQVIYTGTHTGSFDGAQTAKPTNKTVRVPATFIGIARDGKIEDLRGYWDRLLVLRQLGLIPEGS
jgi:steroid delta-isomerase-like uncharacterized protein